MSSFSLYEPVADFYAGKSVFITGGTGFLGKVMIEKLLFSCPKLDKIYVLIREKKTHSPQKRLQDMFELPIFGRLKRERPEDLTKIIPVVGDITMPNLGITEEDEKILSEKINVVFHLAATVMFHLPLKVSMNINFEGTRRTLDLSKKMKDLQAFVYVSTAYSNTDRKDINEIVYAPPVPYEDVYNVFKEHGDDEKKINKILKGQPNTYTFTKALAENYVAEHHGHIPTIIVRPSIVKTHVHFVNIFLLTYLYIAYGDAMFSIYMVHSGQPASQFFNKICEPCESLYNQNAFKVMGSKNEPVEGWIDNWFGAIGTMTMVGKGFLRVMCGKGSNILDLIPVDYVSNLIIAAAAKLERSSKVEVYNSSSSSANPVTLETVCRSFIAENIRLKLNNVPYPSICFTNYHWLIMVITFLTQKIPAYILDCFLLLMGKQQRYLKFQEKLQRLQKEQRYFTSHSWLIHSEHTERLYATLSDSDKSIFQCDPSNIIWSEYLRVCCNGIKTYLL